MDRIFTAIAIGCTVWGVGVIWHKLSTLKGKK